jgi:hypothetical protein
MSEPKKKAVLKTREQGDEPIFPGDERIHQLIDESDDPVSGVIELYKMLMGRGDFSRMGKMKRLEVLADLISEHEPARDVLIRAGQAIVKHGKKKGTRNSIFNSQQLLMHGLRGLNLEPYSRAERKERQKTRYGNLMLEKVRDKAENLSRNLPEWPTMSRQDKVLAIDRTIQNQKAFWGSGSLGTSTENEAKRRGKDERAKKRHDAYYEGKEPQYEENLTFEGINSVLDEMEKKK